MEDRGTRRACGAEHRADRSRGSRVRSPGTGFLRVEPRHLWRRVTVLSSEFTAEPVEIEVAGTVTG